MYSRIVWPKSDAANEVRPAAVEPIKVSYTTVDLGTYENPHDSRKTTSPALLAILKENGVNDVIQSDRFEEDRLNISIYALGPRMSAGTRFVGFPLGILAGITFFILPARGSMINPIEVQIIDPRKESAKRLKIHHSEWIQVDWMWAGFAANKGFVEDDRVLVGNSDYSSPAGNNSLRWERLETTGIRRALRPIIEEALADYRAPAK